MDSKRKKTLIRKYDRTAEIYDQLYLSEQKSKYGAILPSLSLSEADSILDAGCGTGLLIPLIAKRSRFVVGIDISLKMLEQAKRRSLSFGNVDLVLADVEFLPLRDGCFSRIFALTTLQNVLNKGRALKEIKRIGTRNSLKILTLLKKGDETKQIELLEKMRFKICLVQDSEQLKDILTICI